MVKSCCAYGCTRRYNAADNVKFHRFPKNNVLNKQWINAINRKDFQPTSNSFVCSKHFEDSCYYINVHGNKNLNVSAVPSIFEYTNDNLLKSQTQKAKISSTNCFIDHEKPSCSSSGTCNDLEETVTTNSDFGLGLVNLSFTETQNEKNTPIDSLKRKGYVGDFVLKDLDSPNKRRKYWQVSQNTVKQQRSRLKYYTNRNLRLQKRMKTLQNVIDCLVQQNKISHDVSFILKSVLTESQKQMLLRQLQIKRSKLYPPELRTFALTLNFYSSAAYNFVRNHFSNSLPHPTTLQKWYQSADGSPGYTSESLRAIKIKVDEMKSHNKKLVCGLVMDEMAIHEHVEWNGKRNLGYINYGSGFNTNSDGLPRAKNALVFMLVALNAHWKVPIGYFLINCLSADEKANLVKGCLAMLHTTEVKIKSLTFDGAASNISMANILGANLYWPTLNTSFLHPISKEKIYILLDACHMLKLCRNTLGDWGMIKNGDGKEIKWQYFRSLVELQEKSGLHAATKIRARHLNYAKEKMKVKLAAQTLSTSVANALEFCANDLKLDEFQRCQETAEFCKNINNIFDFLNVRNFLGKTKYLSPLAKASNKFVEDFVTSSISYLEQLTTEIGERLIHSVRRTGFLGLIICLKSVKAIFNDLVVSDNLKFILTYKLSQDHLEMFFSAIRSRGGFNNNPTAREFEAAYKRLLIHTEIKTSSSANCLAQDPTSILCISSRTPRHHNDEAISIDSLIDEEPNFSDVNLDYNLNSPFVRDVVTYISGFIIRKILKIITCEVCATELISSSDNQAFSALLNRKNRGQLIKPSTDVVNICKMAETILRQYDSNYSGNNGIQKLIIRTIRNLNISKYFQNLSQHIYDQEPLNNHIYQLIKLILKSYFTLRIHHINNSSNEIKNRIRHTHTKLIHFSHQ